MFVDAAGEVVPDRLVNLKGSIDSFNSDYPDTYRELWERLVRIIETHKRIPQTSTVGFEEADDRLIPKFELPDKDKERIFELCSQMRKIILASQVFDQPHRRRLLDRIAGIEHQVEQPKGMLDVVRAGVSDVGETLGKFGTDIKPLTDRMKEVADIARRGSKEYDQIPAPDEVKQIEYNSAEDEE